MKSPRPKKTAATGTKYITEGRPAKKKPSTVLQKPIKLLPKPARKSIAEGRKPAPKPARKLMPGKAGMVDMPMKDKIKPMPRPSKTGGKPARKPMISRRSGF